MTPDQINAVYHNLRQRTSGPKEFQRQLDLVGKEFTAVEAVLYLTMYSMGMKLSGLAFTNYRHPRVAAEAWPASARDSPSLQAGDESKEARHP